MSESKIYQVSTLQALVLGYFRKVVSVGELLEHGNTGLGTFEDVNGEMIVVDGNCYRATENGKIEESKQTDGVPFASVAFMQENTSFEICDVKNIDSLKVFLNNKIEEDFGLNSMHMAKIDAEFETVSARSESPFAAQHTELKEILKDTQKSFSFKKIKGTLVCLYYPDYMDGINAPGWHFHFISDQRDRGGHVFDLSFNKADALLNKITKLEIELPKEPSFDTYSLKEASQNDIKKIESTK